MKYIIYTLYAATVLLFSGFARAESPIKIVEVLVDQQNLQLEVSGYVPNPCYQTPTPVMTFDQNSPNTLVVRLISPTPTNFCIQRDQDYSVQRIQDFSTIVDLRRLARASQIPSGNAVIYEVKVEGHGFTMLVSGKDLNP